jgi:hypothetical protein
MVLIEPQVGNRLAVAGMTANKVIQKTLGINALNVTKLDEEGEWQAEHIIWGIEVNADTETMAMPAPKLLKGYYAVNDSALDWGSVRIPRKTVQSVTGLFNHLGIVCESVRTELPALYRLLAGDGHQAQWVSPPDDGKDRQQAFELFWEAVEFIRYLLCDSTLWEARFTCGLAATLTPRERIQRRGSRLRHVWTGGDATKELVGTTDWTGFFFPRHEVTELIPAVQTLVPDVEFDAIIALYELIAVVCLVTIRCEDGGEALQFDAEAYAAFDIYGLKRPGAELSYSDDQLAAAKARFESMSQQVRRPPCCLLRHPSCRSVRTQYTERWSRAT